MDPQIRALFNDTIVTEAAARYGIAEETMNLLGGFESFIYEFACDEQGYILRFSHDTHRPVTQICGEVDWITYLADRGVPAARAVPSAHGNLVEVIPDAAGGNFVVTAFEKARGDFVRDKDFNPALFAKLGRLVGRMHRLTQDYTPSDPATMRRPHWHEDFTAFLDGLPPFAAAAIAEPYHEVMDHLHTLPTGRTCYGLIHTDVHRGNFVMDAAGNLTLFDFDDCTYTWFIDDIALALFYAMPVGREETEVQAFARTFLGSFLRAYFQEHMLDLAWFDEIPYFMKARELAVYAALLAHTGGDVSTLDGWSARFMAGRGERIAVQRSCLALDFVDVASEALTNFEHLIR